MTEESQDDLYIRTELESAIVQGDREKFDELITSADLSHRSSNDSTLLHQTVTGPRTGMASELIERGIDIDATDSGGYTALHRAVEKEHLELVELLLENGADPNTTTVYGITPLHNAVRGARLARKSVELPDTRYIELLLEHGADPHLSEDSRNTPLEMAQEAGYSEVVELLEEAAGEQ